MRICKTKPNLSAAVSQTGSGQRHARPPAATRYEILRHIRRKTDQRARLRVTQILGAGLLGRPPYCCRRQSFCDDRIAESGPVRDAAVWVWVCESCACSNALRARQRRATRICRLEVRRDSVLLPVPKSNGIGAAPPADLGGTLHGSSILRAASRLGLRKGPLRGCREVAVRSRFWCRVVSTPRAGSRNGVRGGLAALITKLAHAIIPLDWLQRPFLPIYAAYEPCREGLLPHRARCQPMPGSCIVES